MEDWGKGLCRALGKKIVELTGDFTPDVRWGLPLACCWREMTAGSDTVLSADEGIGGAWSTLT